MDDIVQDAVENKEQEDRKSNVDTATDDNDFGEPRIVVVGCGGAGNNTINRLYNIGVDGADTVALNTDKQHLKQIQADTKILVGKEQTKGLGAGGEPSVGEKATKQSASTIKEVLSDADMVFITAGMGGGTGTGAAPVVAEVAKDIGAVVMAMVSTPFDVERARLNAAKEGLDKLTAEADSVIVLDNNRLRDYVPNLPLGDAFSVMDQIIAETVKGISETITQPSLINLDYADMANIMDSGGVSVMLVGESKDKNKVDDVVDNAMEHALLDVDYRGATGGLVHITGGENLTLDEAQGISEKITARIRDNANLIWGARINEDYNDKVRVMAIMTGVQSDQLLSSTSEKKAQRAREVEQTSSATGGIDRIGD